MPTLGEDAVDLETRCHIEEYTWHVFSILADIIDAALIKLNIPVIVSDKCPPNLGQWARAGRAPLMAVVIIMDT